MLSASCTPPSESAPASSSSHTRSPHSRLIAQLGNHSAWRGTHKARLNYRPPLRPARPRSIDCARTPNTPPEPHLTLYLPPCPAVPPRRRIADSSDAEVGILLEFNKSTTSPRKRAVAPSNEIILLSSSSAEDKRFKKKKKGGGSRR